MIRNRFDMFCDYKDISKEDLEQAKADINTTFALSLKDALYLGLFE